MGHKVQMYENLRDMLEREIGEIERKRDLNKDSLDNLFKLTGALKVVDKCIEKQEQEEEMKKGGGMSMGGQSMRGQSYGGGSMMYPYMGYNAMESRESYGGGSNESRSSYNSRQSNEGGQSGNRGGSYDGSYESNQSNASYDGRRGRDGDSDGRYNESRESRESRDNFRDSQARGQSYERGYSRDNAKKKMIQKLETLMDDTMSEKERQAIRECISTIDK